LRENYSYVRETWLKVCKGEDFDGRKDIGDKGIEEKRFGE